jgi:endonuclease/exonuclease/phosphatase family metal-dependent hydrolase
VLVVHLKAGGDGHDIRARQYVALAKIVSEVKRSGERVVLLGDFNATGDDDRDDLALLARDTGMTWATRELACSAFWSRDDGCPTSRLDHVLTWAPPSKVEAAGACATDGCEWQHRCPLYAEQVSDHCPVVVTF